MFKWFKDFLGYKESGGNVEAIPQSATGKERISGELAMEIGEAFLTIYTTLTLNPQNKLSAKFLVCFNFQSA